MFSGKKIKNIRVIALALVLVMILCVLSGCKKNNTEDQYISEWVWEDVENPNNNSNPNSNTNTGDSSDEKTSNGNTSNGDTSNGNTSNGNTSNVSTPNGNSSNKTPSKGNSNTNKTKDLKGRTITYMTWWEEPKKGSNQQAAEYWKAKIHN